MLVSIKGKEGMKEEGEGECCTEVLFSDPEYMESKQQPPQSQPQQQQQQRQTI